MGEPMPSMMTDALEFARGGWAVFPLAGKIPAIKGGRGVLDATTDEAQVEAWWSQYPGAGIGLACGEPSGVWVLDIDAGAPKRRANEAPEDVVSGTVALLDFEAAYGQIPPTLVSRTGGGGRHLFFRLPPGRTLRNRVSITAIDGRRAGIDLRTTGGYVVLPPSPHPSGGLYRWEDGPAQIADAPEWLLDLVCVREEPRPVVVPRPLADEHDRRRKYGAKVLESSLQRIMDAPAGGRHMAILTAARVVGGYVASGCIDEEHARSALESAGMSAGKSGREVRRTVNDGIESGKQQPIDPTLSPGWSDRPERQDGRRAVDSSPQDFGGDDWGDDPDVSVEEWGAEDLGAEPPPPTVDLSPLIRLREIVAGLEDEASDRTALLRQLFSPELVADLARVRAASPQAGRAELVRMGLVHGLKGRAEQADKMIDAAVASVAADVSATRAPESGGLRRDLGKIAPDWIEDGWVCPAPYMVTGRGVYRERPPARDGTPQPPIVVSRRPILISAVANDTSGAGQYVDLRWHDGHRWCSRWIPRGTCMQRRALAELSQYRVPVSSESAGEVVKWLEAYLAANEIALPSAVSSGVLGWHDGGFLWGSTLIGPNGVDESGRVTLTPDDEGMAQAAAGYAQSGTMEGWCQVVDLIADYPSVYLAIIASVVPCLYRDLPDAPGFLVEWVGKTRSGKTISLRTGAATWGLPSDKAGGIIRTWDATLTSAERLAAACNYLPSIFDDTRRVPAGREGQLQSFVYSIVQGQGRARGTVTGLQVTRAWRTVLMSTGEDRLVDRAQIGRIDLAGGAEARSLSLFGSPLGGESADNALVARRIQRGFMDHHGHLGPRIVSMLQREGAAETLRAAYDDALIQWGKRAGNSSVAQSAAEYVALLQVAYELMVTMGAPACRQDVLEVAWGAATAAAEAAALEVRALQAVYSWASANESKFWGRHITDRDGEAREPHGGWAGAWDSDKLWSRLSMRPERLDEVLKAAGMVPETMLRTWADLGWLVTDGRHRLRKMTVGRERPRCVVISRRAFADCDLL